mgnify:CR=1 FL=1
MHERPMRRIRPIGRCAAHDPTFGLLGGKFVNQLDQRAGIFLVDPAIAVEIIHLPVPVLINIDIGGITIQMAR